MVFPVVRERGRTAGLWPSPSTLFPIVSRSSRPAALSWSRLGSRDPLHTYLRRFQTCLTCKLQTSARLQEMHFRTVTFPTEAGRRRGWSCQRRRIWAFCVVDRLNVRQRDPLHEGTVYSVGNNKKLQLHIIQK